MIKKELILLLVTPVFFIGCNQQIQDIVFYQNTGKVDRSYDVTEETFWDFKAQGDIDSLVVKDFGDFSGYYRNIVKKPYENKPFMNPEYAVIIKTSKSIDTIYINDKLDKGYSVGESTMFEDKTLYIYFKQKRFLTQHTKSLSN